MYRRLSVAIFVALVFAGFESESLGYVSLSFDSDVTGTITDINGIGTGFTHRLPDTGGGLPSLDPNLELLGNGLLAIKSTKSDFNYGGVNLPELETPGVLVNGTAGRDLVIQASFRDVNVPFNWVFLYAGVDANHVVKAGFHPANLFMHSEDNGGVGDDNTLLSNENAYATGDDIELTWSRTSGMWTLAWNNLTSPHFSGSSAGIEVPWLLSEDSLYIGVTFADPGPGTPSVTNYLDEFSVTVGVPEPSSFVLAALGLIGLVVWRRRKR